MEYEELLKDRLEEYHYEKDAIMVSTAFLDMFAKDYATMKCKELLLLVAEKVQCNVEDYHEHSVDKDSILNAVDLNEFIV